MIEDPWWLHVLLVVTGLFAGFINAMAAGGSMLTLPLLMLCGLPADIANGTNRVAMVSMSATGTWSYQRKGQLETHGALWSVIPTVLGAGLGAVGAAHVPPDILKPTFLVVMVVAAIVIVARPQWIVAPDGSAPRFVRDHKATVAALFVAGMYGGFIRAGVGFALLAIFAGLLHNDKGRANALKLLCTTSLGALALIIFAFADQVNWLLGAELAIGTVVGGQVGVRVALKVSAKFVSWLVFVAIIAACGAAFIRD